jgi:hypothetical protein
MNKINSVQEAYDLEKLDASKVDVIGVPERHREAIIAVAHLFMVHDAVNPEFQPDFSNYDQDKFENWFEMGSSSGVGFAYCDFVDWYTVSGVGSRLVSESSEAAKYIGNHPEFQELFKKFMVYQRELKK